MASKSCLRNNKELVLYLLLLVFITSTLISASQYHLAAAKSTIATRRFLLDLEDEDDNEPIVRKQKTTSGGSSSSSSNSKSAFSTKKNQTKLTKPSSSTSSITSSKNQIKLTKPSSSTSSSKNKKNTDLNAAPKNKNKIPKTIASSHSDSDDSSTTIPIESQFKKLNSTSKSSSKTNSTSTKKISSSDPSKLTSSKIKTTTTKPDKPSKSKTPDKSQPKKPQKQQQPKPTWLDQEDDDDEDDFVAELRDLPSKFQELFMPDLERISKTSKVYLNKYNKEFTKGFKPYVGNKYASTIASLVSFAFIVIPLILVWLIFSRIKAYFSLQKLLIFIQVYLAIYFTILCMSSLATGLEPLRFFYSTSRSTYVCVQVMQTLAYVLYMLLLLMYLILVFSSETGPATKLLGLGQTFVGFAVGLHYYMTVFHRAVLRQPPKTSSKVQAIYATCFVVICLLGGLERRRKKAYLEKGGEEGKKS